MRIFLRNFIIIVLFVFLAGCTWLPKGKKDFLQDFKFQEAQRFVQSLRIKEADLLQKGARILIVPFVAGESVVASEELHKTALMMVRGVYDEFADKKSRFEIMTKETMGKSDFIIEGHVIEWFEPSWFSRLFLCNKTKILRLEGRMTDLDTGKIILTFEDRISTKRKQISYRDLGYVLGVRLGKMILSHDKIKKSPAEEGEK